MISKKRRRLRGWIPIVLLGFLLLGWAGTFFWFNYRLTKLEKDLSAKVSMAQGAVIGEIGSISGNISFALQEQNNLLTETGSHILSLNKEDRTVTLELSAVPKTVTDTLRLDFACRVDGKDILLPAKKGDALRYTAEITLPLTTDLLEVQAQLTDNEETKTQICESVYQPGGQYLLSAYLNFPPGYSFTPSSGECSFQNDIGVTFNNSFVNSGSYLVENLPVPVSASVIAEKNGVEVHRAAHPLELQKEEIFTYEIPMDEKYVLAKGDDLVLRLEVTDSNGLLYRVTVLDITRQDGELISNDTGDQTLLLVS